MITDHLRHLSKYPSLLPHLQEIIAYLDANDISQWEEGRYPILGEAVYMMIQQYTTQPQSNKKWESHKKYIDLQIVLSGEEYMCYHPIDLLTVSDAYKEEEDYMLYHNDVESFSYIKVPQDYFCVFYPEDGHKPGIHLEQERAVKKAVIKIAV